jgi:molecular chaperone GrpE (heat shock protein)
MSFLSLLTSRGRFLGLLLGVGALGLAGLYLRSSGYQKGYRQSELICEAAKAEQSLAVAERLGEIQRDHQRRLDELQSQNNLLNSELNDRIGEIDEYVNRETQRIPEISTGDSCDIPYDALRVLDNLARAPS